jgi:hypothetical protein
VAVLAPLPDTTPLNNMRASGELMAASVELSDLPEPLPLPKGHRPPSEILAGLRADER